MKKITIPIEFGYPTALVVINNHIYFLRTGEEIEVEDCVADLFENIDDNSTDLQPDPNPGNPGDSPDGSGGGTAGSSEMVEQWIRAIEGNPDNPVTKLPDGVTKIGDYEFFQNKALAITSLPNGVTTIGTNAFYFCENIVLTSIPASVTSIDDYAFEECGGLQELTFKGKPAFISDLAFSSCANLKTINVPWAEDEVAGAPWGAYDATINYNYAGG